ncbi:hypothetical protein R3P38DRAFT_2800721 [Favolaschia claudopus]|uniref:Uncharacterized protein n=1 Tax=Favolaschia claudopus TaxID=2862362 RepID=A0AAV9ZXA4_9AGAR
MGGIHATYSEKSTPPAEVHPKSESQLENSTLQHYKDSAEKYCWNQICPKWPTNHGSVTAKGLTGLVDLLYGLERKPYGENRNSDSRVNCAPIALVVSGVLARFRDIDFRWGQASNTATEQIRNPARQHQSRDVKVGDNPAALATVTGNWAPNSFKRVPKREEFGATTTAWEGIGGNSEKIPPKSREFGATAGIGSNTNPPRILAVETNAQ